MGFCIIAGLLVLCLIFKSFIFSGEVTMFQIHQQLGWIAVCVLMVGAQIDGSARQIIKKIENKEQTQKETNEILKLVFNKKIKTCLFCKKPIRIEEESCPFCGNTADKEEAQKIIKEKEETNFMVRVGLAIILVVAFILFVVSCMSSNDKIQTDRYKNDNSHTPAAQLYK